MKDTILSRASPSSSSSPCSSACMVQRTFFIQVSILTMIIINSVAVNAYDFSCDALNDPCPAEYQQDGQCDNEYGFNIQDCIGGDCADCDLCFQFNLDCDACLEHGCYWCAASALCTNSNAYSLNDEEGCQTSQDFVRDSCSAPGAFFSDPLYSAEEWSYTLINVRPVWELGYTGKGVHVRVNDDGVDGSNIEFAGRFDFNNSCDDYMPLSSVTQYSHGTAVASIIGGGANDHCAVGIAPEVIISSCYVLKDDGAALNTRLETVDISQNSFGNDACALNARVRRRRRLQQVCPFTYNDHSGAFPCDVCNFTSTASRTTTTISATEPEYLSQDCKNSIIQHCKTHYAEDTNGCVDFLDLYIKGGRCEYNTLQPDEKYAITRGITEGRGGKGIIYVWAAGNTYGAGEDTNFEGFLNTRFTIAVGAVTHDGLHAPYSTAGAALFLVAPGGDADHRVNHVVADIGGTCTSIGYGTSMSCPVVSGVVALILEANPDLTWRDVQWILATSSKMVEDAEDDSRYTNAAGIAHSNWYGFGIVDAYAAVLAALGWELVQPEEMLAGESRLLDIIIPDNPKATIVSTINLVPTHSKDFIAESVVVYLQVQHFSRGDLDISLTSPQGTMSTLSPGNRPENTVLESDEEWELLTLRAWGESARGNWTISITDISTGDVAPCANFPFVASIRTATMNKNMTVDCDDAQKLYYCSDGELQSSSPDVFVDASYRGRTAHEACCVCGGGANTTDFVDQFVRWKIVAYGQSSSTPLYSVATGSSGPKTSGSEVDTTGSEMSTNDKPSSGSTSNAYISTTIYYFNCLLLVWLSKMFIF